MATSLSTPVHLVGHDILVASTVQQHNLGAYAETPDGRGFRYGKVGAVATLPGRVYQSPALDATNQTLSGGHSVAAAAIGATTVTLTNSITLAANLVAGGYMSVVVAPGIGYTYRIASNTGVSAAAGMVITLEDPLVVALTTSSKIIICKHPYDGIVIDPGTPTGVIVGIPTAIYPIGSFCWVQVSGPCAALFTGTGAASKAVGSLTGGTSGSLAPAIAATNIAGYHMATGITAEYSMVYLDIH